jgi:hypothetical protein
MAYLLPSPWRGAALARARRSRDILSGARKAKYGFKQAAPGNDRTRCFVPSCRLGILDPLNAPINLSRVETFAGAACLKSFAVTHAPKTNIPGLSGTIQSGSPPEGGEWHVASPAKFEDDDEDNDHYDEPWHTPPSSCSINPVMIRTSASIRRRLIKAGPPARVVPT